MSSPADAPGHSQTLDELRRIIRRIEAKRPPRPAPEPVEEIVGGEVVETGQGPVLVARREFPLSHRHGAYPLAHAAAASGTALGLIGRLDHAPVDPRALLFLDTETTGLAGGTGTYPFLVGAGYLDGERFVVEQYFMRDLDEEPALLEVLAPRLERASGVVTFNGGGFDLPLLETRFILARRRWPAPPVHVDLLRPARRVWAPRLADCRLSTLEREVLGACRAHDVPGFLIPTLYFDFLRSRRARPLARVFAHNLDDVLALAALLGWFVRAVEGGTDGLSPEELAGLGRLWEAVDPERSLAYYRAALEAGLDGDDGRRVRLRVALAEKRRARWEAACALWRAAAGAPVFDPRPWEELAKYHEHRRRDPSTARAIVLEAAARAQRAGAGARTLDALAHRLARLERRLRARAAAVATAGAVEDGRSVALTPPVETSGESVGPAALVHTLGDGRGGVASQGT